eukprot:8350094-Ditylum_brightwellii.AAC.1
MDLLTLKALKSKVLVASMELYWKTKQDVAVLVEVANWRHQHKDQMNWQSQESGGALYKKWSI